MKIDFNSFEGEFITQNDLKKIVPEKRKGKALNYGRGEGQIEIDETVWGVYFGENGNYYMQFEEGHLPPSEFINLLHDLITHIQDNLKTKAVIGGLLGAEGPIQSEL